MPLERIINKNEHGRVAIWHLSESLEELLAQITLSTEDRTTLNGFKLDKRKKEWACTRLLLNQLLNHYPEIKYTDNGKPFLTNSDLHISISHTQNFVAVSLSSALTALDIELNSPRVEKAASRFMHEEEWEFIKTNKTTYLTIIWCAKETLYKYFDEYGVIFKDHFRIKSFNLESDHCFESHCCYQNHNENLQLNFEVTPNYVLVYHLK